MTVLKFCNGCRKLFEPKAWQRTHNHASYCPDCSPEDPRWSTEYRRARAKRLRIARNTCEGCRSVKVGLECHHVNGNPKDHRVANLRMLCGKCHKEAGKALRSGQGSGPPSQGAPTKPVPAVNASDYRMRLT